MSDVFCYGELGVDNIIRVPGVPTPESAAFPTSETYRIGGAAANTAVWLAGWGVRTALAGNVVGKDEYGRALLRWLRRFRALDLRHVKPRAGVVTPFCRVMVTPDGERSILVYWFSRTPKVPLTREILGRARFLALDLYGGGERVQAARVARTAGAQSVVGDVVDLDNPVLPLSGIVTNSAAYVRERYPGVDVESHSRALREASGGIVVTTDGAGPVRVLARDGTAFSVWPPEVEAREATGAGDAFRAGLIYGLLRGWDLERCVCWATAAGSLKVGLPDGFEVPGAGSVDSLASTLRAVRAA